MATGDYYPKNGLTAAQEEFGDWMFFSNCGGSYVVEGLALTDNGGTDVLLETGVAMVNGKVVEITSTETLTVTDNATRYVGLSNTGVLEQQTGIDDRGDLRLPIAKVVTSGGSISSITYDFSRSTGIHADSHVGRLAGEVLIVKESDETVNSSTSMQSDDELAFSPGDNQKWDITIGLIVNSGATPDFKFEIIAGLETGYFTVVGPLGTIGGLVGIGDDVVVTTSGSDESILVRGVLYNGNSGSTIGIRWAQNTSDPGNTTVKAGSYLHARRIKC